MASYEQECIAIDLFTSAGVLRFAGNDSTSSVCDFIQKDCPNGQLTRAKFLEVYSSFFPQGNAEKFCEHVFRTFDSDNSGKIDFKEFLLAINITSAGKPEQKLEWAFQMYDVNGDGTIEPSEMSEIIGVSTCPYWISAGPSAGVLAAILVRSFCTPY